VIASFLYPQQKYLKCDNIKKGENIMRTKSLILISTTAMAFSATFMLCNTKKETKTQKPEIVEIDSDYFLNSSKPFNEFKVEKRGGYQTVVNASAPIKNFYSIEKLSTANPSEYKNKTLYASIDSLDTIGIVTIDLCLKDDLTGENDVFERIYAYPTIDNETEKYDLKLDIHGNTILTSNIDVSNKIDISKLSSELFVIDRPIIDIGLKTNVLYPIVDVALDLVQFSKAQTMVAGIINIPSLSLTNPLPYFFYTAKVELAKQHYNHNIVQTNQPGHYIDSQAAYGNFKFGISERNLGQLRAPNIDSTGCGIVAAYNMLKDSGANIDFPSLIALYEICGADLLGGYLGVNPVPDYLDTIVIPVASASLLAVYASVLQPILNLALTFIEPLLFALCSWTPLDLIIPLISITVAVSAATAIRVIINESGRAVSEFLNWYSTYSKSETEMLRLFYGNKLLDYSFTNFSGFKTKLATRSQAIICFWNGMNDDGSIDVSDGAHFIYVKSNSIDSFGKVLFESHNNGNNNLYEASQIQNFFGSAHSTNQFIWGYILSN